MPMKKIFFCALILFTGITVFGQSKAVTDTIVRVDTKILPVNVTTVTPNFVSFAYPGNQEVYTIDRKDVHKIIYKTGKVEILNKPAVMTFDDTAWESVWLTEDRKDVANMYKLGEIEATSPPSSRSVKAAKKGATIKLQKRAANLKGSIVLVTYKEKTGGYGELPGYIIKGIVYGYEPPAEE
jgi:hypothetical protein